MFPDGFVRTAATTSASSASIPTPTSSSTTLLAPVRSFLRVFFLSFPFSPFSNYYYSLFNVPVDLIDASILPSLMNFGEFYCTQFLFIYWIEE